MAKRFKLRFSRVIPSFQFCRSKHPSTFPVNPIPSIYRLSPINPKVMDITYPTNFPNPPPSTPQHYPTPVHPSSINRHVSFKSVTVGCGCRSRSCARYLSSECTTESPDYTWTRNGKWHVIGKVDEEEEDDDDDKPRRKIYSPSDSGNTDDDGPVTPLLNSSTKQIKKQKSKKKKNVRTSVRTSTSSGDSGWFTSEENDEETETLVSSRSFSNNSSNDFDDQFDSKSKKQSNNSQTKSNTKNVSKLKRHKSKNWKGSSDSATGKTKTKNKTPSPELESAVRTSVLRRMMSCKVEGKVMESFAVVKKSEDPYEDFRRSMLEMIFEKQMFDAKELEELLHCFLSLNSRHHHGVIVEAFSEIWEVLFSGKSPANQKCANLLDR